MAWVKLDDGFWQHAKLLTLSLAAEAVWVNALAWCNHQGTDGFVPRAALVMLAKGSPDADALGKELVEAGLWDPVEDRGWQVHDYLDYQPSRAERQARRAQRVEAGRRGAAARWGDQRTDATTSTAGTTPNGAPHGGGYGKGYGKRMAPVDATAMANDAPGPSRPGPSRPDPHSHPEGVRDGVDDAVERLCTTVADEIQRQSGLWPPVTQRWREDARDLLDQVDVDVAIATARWALHDDWWSTRVTGVPALVRNYSTIARAAQSPADQWLRDMEGNDEAT